MNVVDGKVNYNMCLDRELGYSKVDELIRDNTNYANMEIENVKRLSKKLIIREENDSK